MNDKNISSKQGNRIKTKSLWFNGTTSKLDDIENIKKFCIEFPFWAYIMHTPDDECEKLHIHFLVYSRGQVTIKNVAETLCCDYGDVQDTRQEKTYARYMLHQGWSDKKQYSLSDVVSNDKERFSSFLTDIFHTTHDLFGDLELLRDGRLSKSEFLKEYQGEFSSMTFYQKIRVYSEIERICRY